MKKITLLFAVLASSSSSAFAQVTTYTGHDAFEEAYGQPFISEDFSGAPEEPFICGTVVGSEASDCFDAGELVGGFTISTIENGPVVLLPAGFLPSQNTTPRLGANSGADTTVITFTGDGVYAAGHALHVDNNNDFNYKVTGTDGEVIYDGDHVHSPFFGIISATPIKTIEIASLADNGELVGDLLFGTENAMGAKDFAAAKITAYPNPAGNTLTVKAGLMITNVTVYNLLGQAVLQQDVSNAVVSVSLTGLASGNYIVKAELENGAGSTFRIVKK